MTLNVLSDVRDGLCILRCLKMWVCVCLRECVHLSETPNPGAGFDFGGGGGCTWDAALPWHQETAIIMCVYM